MLTGTVPVDFSSYFLVVFNFFKLFNIVMPSNTDSASNDTASAEEALQLDPVGLELGNFMQRVENWFVAETGLSGYWYWVTEIFVLVFLTLVVNLFIRVILKRLQKKAEQSDNLWDDAFMYAARRPIPLLMWVLGFGFVISSAAYRFETDFTNIIDPAILVGIIVSITWLLTRLVLGVERNLVKRPAADGKVQLDESTAHALGKLVRLAIVITATLVTLEAIGISISALLAFGGIGGIAIGFAAKDLLSNFFGGLMIYLDRPFAIGDWISSPDKQIEGTVEHIGWRTTCVRKFDKRPLYIPNQVFTTAVIENPSRMTNRRIYETIGVRYDDATQVEKITVAVRDMLQNHADIDTQQTLMVNFNEYGPSSMDFFIYTFTKTTVWTEYHEIKQAILLEVGQIIEAHGAEIAFPTQTLHMVANQQNNCDKEQDDAEETSGQDTERKGTERRGTEKRDKENSDKEGGSAKRKMRRKDKTHRPVDIESDSDGNDDEADNVPE